MAPLSVALCAFQSSGKVNEISYRMEKADTTKKWEE